MVKESLMGKFGGLNKLYVYLTFGKIGIVIIS